MGTRVVQRVGKQGKERGERGDGEKEREADRRKEEGGEKGSTNQTASQGIPSSVDFAWQRRTCLEELNEGKRPELEPRLSHANWSSGTHPPTHPLAFTPSLVKTGTWSPSWVPVH